MATYEELLIESDLSRLVVKEKPLRANDGRIRGNRIAIRSGLSTCQKGCVLAEELGHYHTAVGDILDQSSVANRKREALGRVWAYDKMVGLTGIISAYCAGCRNLYETANHLQVTEEFLLEAISYYRGKYGPYTRIDNYVIYFDPSVGVLELIDSPHDVG